MKRRILYINNRYRKYDRLKYVTLATHFDLTVLWISHPLESDPIPDEIEEALTYSFLHNRKDILKPWHLIRSLKLVLLIGRYGEQTDLLLSSTSDSWKSKIVYLASWFFGLRVAFRKENWADREKKMRGIRRLYWAVQKRLTQYIEDHAEAVLVGGQMARTYLVRRGFDERNIYPFHYLHDDLSKYPVDNEWARQHERQAPDEIRFLYLGRIMPQKGLDVLIKVFMRILQEGMHARLLVVGEPITEDTGRGPTSTRFYDTCRALAGDNEHVVFLGGAPPDRVHQFYACADVFVHPHVRDVDGVELHDGWGNVITEAACMSLPIIASDRVASAFDIVDNGVNGFLVRADHLEYDLYEAMCFFLNNPSVIQSFGSQSRNSYERVVNPQQNVETLRYVIERHGQPISEMGVR